MITCNGTAFYLWEILKEDCSEEQLVDALLKEYEVSEEQAQKGVANTLDILRKNQNPPNDDYVMLQPETIEKIKDRDDEVIKKLEKKVEHESTNYLKDNIADNIKLDFINDIEAIIKNALDYGLTEWEKPQVVPLSSTTGDKIDILLPNWL